jgi:drug/metabolite transporter (DMT)-like permease
VPHESCRCNQEFWCLPALNLCRERSAFDVSNGIMPKDVTDFVSDFRGACGTLLPVCDHGPPDGQPARTRSCAVNGSPALISLISPLAVQASIGRPGPRTLAVLALVGANMIWGASAVASKAVLVHVSPLTMACLRVAIALAVLLPLTARSGERPARGSAPALLGLTGVTLFCLLQNVDLRYASAANAALINGAIPVLTALLAAALLGERLGGRRIAGLLISGAGVAVVVLLGTGATLGASILGNVLLITGAVSFAAYAVLGRRIFSSGNTLAVVAGSTRYGLLFLIPGAVLELATVGIGPVTMDDGLLLLYLGVGCSAFAFVLCGYGLARLDAGQSAVFGNLKPLVGVVLAAALLGESLTPGRLWGGALVLLGVLLASANAATSQTGARKGIFRWRHVWNPAPGGSTPASYHHRR